MKLGLIPGGPSALRLRRSLGQPPDDLPFKVVVTDSRGNPFPGAKIHISAPLVEPFEITTGTDGEALTGHTQGPLDVTVEVNGYVVRRRVEDTYQTLFIQLPVCWNGELFTRMEMGLLAGCAALAGAGWYWKKNWLTVPAEIVFGAVVFNFVFRNNCRG